MKVNVYIMLKQNYSKVIHTDYKLKPKLINKYTVRYEMYFIFLIQIVNKIN